MPSTRPMEVSNTEKKKRSENYEKDNSVAFTPRDYQIEILECARKQNTIACLGTGTGKTFIAVMLIRENALEVRRPYDAGGKRIFFLVPTVPLVNQQSKTILDHTDLKVRGYFGEMDVDSWKKDQWENEFAMNEVLVMTAEIFRIILHHTFIPMDKIQLLIFDECHRAQKDHPYRQIMKYITDKDIKVIPRIFCLSASLLNGKCKPTQLEKNLRGLERTLRSSITTASDITDIQKYGTDPVEYVIFYKKSTTTDCDNLKAMLEDALGKLSMKEPHNKEFIGTEDASMEQDPDFFLKPTKSVRQLLYILTNLGIWCAHKAAEIFLKEVSALYNRPYNDHYKSILGEIISFLDSFMRKCNESDMKITEKTLDRSTHKLQRLMELFATIKISDKFKISPNIEQLTNIATFEDDPVAYHQRLKLLEEMKRSESVPICSIIFVEQRITAYVLSQWILEVARSVPGFDFMKPTFLVGHGQAANAVKATSMSVVKQRKILKDFREKDINILVATSVLEEGMDIQQCNVVVRFDLPVDFRSYVQSKGRARARDSIYVLLVDHLNDIEFLQDMCNFRTIEQMLLSKCHNREMPSEEDIQFHMSDDQIPPYMPYGINGPRIGLTSSISLINRYCSKLPCDMSTKLTPNWNIKEVDPDAAKKTFLCYLRMPINSPIRQTICSEELPQRRLAKMSAALKACQLLHEIGELNDNLVPISSLVDKAFESELGSQEEEVCEPGVQPGTNRRRQVYSKKVPIFVSNAKPVANVNCYLHVFQVDLAVPLPASLNPRKRILINPSKSTRGFGILLTKKIPQICPFPIFTKSGKVLVNVKLVEPAVQLSEEEIEKLEEFHRFIFIDVFSFEKGKIFTPKTAENSFYIVAVNKGIKQSSYEIDWNFINATAKHDFNHQRHNINKLKKTRFDESIFKDAVLLRSYVASTWDTEGPSYHYVQKILHNKTPNDKFEESDYQTFKGYYKVKYNSDIIYDDQPLIETVRCGSGSMWKPVYISPKEIFDSGKPMSKTKFKHQNYREFLVPELCLVHPFSVQMFEKALYLPTILFRLNSLLLAEELRQNIAMSAFVGTTSLSPGFQWPIFNFETSDEALKKHLIDRGELTNEDLKQRFVPQDIALSGSKVVSFEAKVDLNGHPGPCPSMILQALTAKGVGDEFDLERLETIGDSFLKYAMSIKIYVKYPQFDEGKLTALRMRLIRNLFLYQCAKKKKLGEYLICSSFDCNRTWLPPCYDVDELVDSKSLVKKTKSDRAKPNNPPDTPTCFHYFKQQIISDKCVADSVEALIGAYLLTCGQQGALRVMFWLGLNPFAKDIDNVCENDFENWLVSPGRPIITDAPNTHQRLLALTDGFEKFESEINYRFKDRAYLLQAFTHPSYSYNDITDCYQRLEFIGDAILDYLITRQLYENPKNHSPGELTDLRSALVNNIYFASLVVKHNFHKYLKMLSPTLFKLLTNYVDILENSDAFLFFKEHSYYLEEVECFDLEEVEVPKALGDLFESVAGAIYFDSGMSLDAVWKVYEPLMKPAMDHYCDHLPKSPVREFYEQVAIMFPKFLKPKNLFGEAVVKEDKTYIEIKLPDGSVYCGVGPSKKVAKRSAAKRAIAEMKNYKK